MSDYSKQLFANNAVALLQSSIGTSDLSLQVQTGLGNLFPQPLNEGEWFTVTLESISAPFTREIIKIVARAGDTLIVDPVGRGWENTNAASWVASQTLVDHRVTAESIRQALLLPVAPTPGIAGISIQDEGSALPIQATTLNFVGSAISIVDNGTTKDVVVTIPPSGISGLDVEDEGTLVPVQATTLNFTGSGVTVVDNGTTKNIFIPGGGGGGGSLDLISENASGSQTPPIALGTDSVAIGYGATTASGGIRALALGDQSLARHRGAMVFANGRFASSGDVQSGKYLLRTVTVNQNATELFLDGTGGSQRLVMPDDSTWTFKATITAHRTDVSDGHAGYVVEGVIYRLAGASTVSFQGAPIKNVIAESNPEWDINILSDTVSGGLTIRATGQAGKIIRWAALIETLEVTN